MCGIAGFAGPSARDSAGLRQSIAGMTSRLAHRGPDDSGLWIDEQVPVAFGHRRLSILDLSPDGRQPMVSAGGRYVLTYNGEIYNFREIRNELSAWCAFRGASDTEVLLAAFERHGVEKALKRFNGMFAFGVWDREERALHLACDRFGEKPLYYGLIGRRLVFGSELKALRAHEGFSTEIDRAAVGGVLNLGYIPAPQTIYRGVRKLEPGTWLTFFPGRKDGALPAPQRYWVAEAASLRAASMPLTCGIEEAASRLEALLEDSVRLRMISDVPVGAFLSGGYDSTAIVAMMRKHSSQRVRTFTIGLDDAGYNEAGHAWAVAEHLGTEHSELRISSADALAIIPKLPSVYDEPFADSSAIPTFLLAQFARAEVTVALSGDGGDELFGGYTRHVWVDAVWKRMARLPLWARTLVSRALTGVSAAGWDSLMRVAGPAAPSSLRQSHPGDKVHKLAAVLGCESREEVYAQLISVGHESGAGSPAFRSFEAPGNRFSEWMMFQDTVGYLPGDILCKLDRAAMAVSLETRVPMLDPRLFEFAWSLPPELRTGKRLLRELAHKYVPREMMERPKTGFAVPMDAWLRGPLREWAEALLDPAVLKREGLLDAAPVARRWKEHQSGSRNHAASLWCVLMLQAWMREQGI